VNRGKKNTQTHNVVFFAQQQQSNAPKSMQHMSIFPEINFVIQLADPL